MNSNSKRHRAIGAFSFIIKPLLRAENSYQQTSSTTNSNNTFERSYGEKIDLDKAFPEQYEVGKTIIGD